MLRQHDTLDLVKRLERDGTYRVLRKLEVPDGRTGVPYHGVPTFIAVVVDVETTGLNVTKDVIIELALRRVRFDSRGRILKIDAPYTWFQDPGRPLEEEIVRLTGLSNAGLEGQDIDEAAATRIFKSAHLVIAHNAAFDRRFIEKRLPEAAGLPWACSMSEVDWVAAGFDGRALGWLGLQAGWFFDAHRASGDVDAVIALLSHVLPDGRPVLAELVARSAAPSMRIEAVGADFAVKDDLRDHGYRWNSDAKVWWKDVSECKLAEEQGWLSQKIYGADCRSRSSEPRITMISARERYT